MMASVVHDLLLASSLGAWVIFLYFHFMYKWDTYEKMYEKLQAPDPWAKATKHTELADCELCGTRINRGVAVQPYVLPSGRWYNMLPYSGQARMTEADLAALASAQAQVNSKPDMSATIPGWTGLTEPVKRILTESPARPHGMLMSSGVSSEWIDYKTYKARVKPFYARTHKPTGAEEQRIKQLGTIQDETLWTDVGGITEGPDGHYSS